MLVASHRGVPFALALLGLAAGLALRAGGLEGAARLAFAAGVAPALAALAVEIVRGLRRGDIGLDLLAGLSMSAALAVGESLAAAVVAVMYTGGTLLEGFAEGRARREMRALLARVPRTATRRGPAGLEDVPLGAIVPGDVLLVRRGEVVAVDGTVRAGLALLDTAALTGEPLPRRHGPGAAVMSGAVNAGEAFELRAARGAAESTYAGIVRLVEAAQASRAPMARLADRWSLVFLAVTLVLAVVAWAASGDPVRAVAVLVVATPCPLILAVPVALVAAMSRAAQHGVLVKGADALERLARVDTIILDKTGTLTHGSLEIVAIMAQPGFAEPEVLGLAAALDQASQHPLARALVAEARARGLDLPAPSGVAETPGEGVAGQVAGRAVRVGSPGFAAGGAGLPGDAEAGAVVVAVALDGRLAGHLVLSDPARAGSAELMAALRDLGVRRIWLATGDRPEVAARVAEGLGLDRIEAGLSPEGKVALVHAARAARGGALPGGTVMMVGDGINDAPALAAADVGVAMGARGAAASSEAADVVLLVDRLDPLAEGAAIARGARAIALQSVLAGIGLSTLGMIAAALGHLPPVQGALLQEAIDVAVIINALRVLRLAPRAGGGQAGPAREAAL